MGISIKSGIRDHDRFEIIIPKGGMITEPYGGYEPTIAWNGQLDNREFPVFLKGPVQGTGKGPRTEIPHNADKITDIGIAQEHQRKRVFLTPG